MSYPYDVKNETDPTVELCYQIIIFMNIGFIKQVNVYKSMLLSQGSLLTKMPRLSVIIGIPHSKKF